MARKAEVPLEERRTAYASAEGRALRAGAAYLESRAAGRGPRTPEAHELDEALSELRRAERRLDGTVRRLAKKVGSAVATP